MSETTVQGNIVMNEQLNIAIDRVEKLDDPLLVIGLGGTGADILLTVVIPEALQGELWRQVADLSAGGLEHTVRALEQLRRDHGL